ncbi:hypothetical protein RvY_06850-5 [Ramazzottius varieornatus]|uniref:Receptor ligand binding region domain-containing protein n=1 Tax=Ramazzottius varieornatus TaxID=947166 RepID=A0A1D1V2U5_RAMVA|nr:hypothetical protein RvY_06850-5 [Ramazzottius varieornatus]
MYGRNHAKPAGGQMERAADYNVRINSDIQIRFKAQSPTWVTTSIAPSVYQGYMCLGLLRFYNWTSAYVLVDEGARNYFTNTAKLTLQLMARQYFLHVTFTFNSRKSDFDFTEMLTKMARERRGMYSISPARGSSNFLQFVHTCRDNRT